MTQNQIPNPYATERSAIPTPGSPVAAGSPSALGVKPDARLAQAFLTQAFLWMFVGLLISAGVAFFVQSNERLIGFAADNFFLLFMGQLALVVVISWGINRINATVALGLFFIYAATLGLTIGLIVSAYTGTSVATAFLSASAMFGAAAIYGSVTKRSLAGLGGILFMAVIGLVVASVVNIFFASSVLTWIISLVGVVIFTALTTTTAITAPIVA